jgi:VWFA-related protein
MSRKSLFALLALLCLCVPAISQTQSDDVIRITTNLVQIDAVVTKQGKLIKDLKAEDFEIYEDGKLQTITSFAYVSNLRESGGALVTPETTGKDPNKPSDPRLAAARIPPELARRRIALVVDDYGLSNQSMARVRRQLGKFINERLHSNDLVAIIRTSRARRELPQFTNDKGRLNETLEQVKWNQCSRVGVKSDRESWHG